MAETVRLDKQTPVALLDLSEQYLSIQDELDRAVMRVCKSQRFILGPEVESFESDFATYCTAEHAIGVSSGTDALLISLMLEGVGPGDEVITTPYTFFATAGCIARLGARPVFVDIEPNSFNIDVSKIEEKISKKTKAIMPVHLYGQCAEMNEILSLGEKYEIPVIEDAAQAVGAKYHSKHAGVLGTTACFSFFPSKNLGGFGDGGMVTTNDQRRAENLRSLRMHGETSRYHHQLVGGNFRLDALQAAVLAVKLKHLDSWSRQRKENAEAYKQFFSEAGLVGTIALPDVLEGRKHVYNQFVIRAPKRDLLREYMNKSQIGNNIYYPVPLHLQQCFSHLEYSKGDFPESELAASETLALPIYPELKTDQLEQVVHTIVDFYREQ